jgi:hypothetical protein
MVEDDICSGRRAVPVIKTVFPLSISLIYLHFITLMEGCSVLKPGLYLSHS